MTRDIRELVITGVPRYEVPASIKRFVELISAEPVSERSGPDHARWKELVNQWIGSRPDSFFEKRGVDILTYTKRLPFYLVEKIMRTERFQELDPDRKISLMNRAVTNAYSVEYSQVINLVLNGFDESVLKNKAIDLNAMNPYDPAEVHPAIPLLLQRSSERIRPSADHNPVLDTIKSIIYLDRETPLSAATLSAIIQSPEFIQLSQDDKKRLCEDVAILHGGQVMSSLKMRSSNKLAIPSLFDLIKMNTHGIDDYVVALTSITDINAWCRSGFWFLPI